MEPRKNTHCGRARFEAGALAALLCMLGAGFALPVLAQEEASADSAPSASEFSAAELDGLVGRIALYPDDLIAIILPASTYPLEVVEAARFEEKRAQDPSLKPKEDWDDSIVALLNYPEVLKLMNDDLDWTSQLGEAVAAQQADVFDAIQRFRDRAVAAGNLESDEHQVVSNDEGDVEIKPADPKVVYVPYYEPERVILAGYGPLYYYPYAYPLYYYPYPAGYSFGTGFFFGVTTAFVIGWHAHYIHVDRYTYIGHPYYGHHYYAPFYVRRSIALNVNLVNRGHGTYAWRPSSHRARYGHSVQFAHSGRAHYANRPAGRGPDRSFDHSRASGGSGHSRASGGPGHSRASGGFGHGGRASGGFGHGYTARSMPGRGLGFRTPGRSVPSTHAGTAPRAQYRNDHGSGSSNRWSGGQNLLGRTFGNRDGAAPQTTTPRAHAQPPRTIGGIAERTHRPASPPHSHGSSSYSRGSSSYSHGSSYGGGMTHGSHGPRAGDGHGSGHRSTGNSIRGGRASER